MARTSTVRRWAAAALAAAVVGSTSCASVPRAQEPREGVAGELDAIAARLGQLEGSGLFSGAVLVARDGEVVFENAYGEANRERAIPNEVDTQFNLASIGKTFTGVAVSQLAEEGLIDLNAPVARYLPWLPRAIGARVTAEHLLTHTSGLHDFFRDPAYERLEPTLTSVSAYRPFIARDRPEFRPGKRFMYSNSGYVLLGMVIEKVSGQSYYDYVQEHVFDVAGMKDTGFFGHDEDATERAIGYTRRGSGGELHDNAWALPPRGSPAGGAYSTIRDMLAFSEALWSYRLLTPEWTRRATTSKLDDPGGGYGYGFGIRRGPAGEPPSIGHNGGAPGVSTELTMNPRLGYTVVVLSNFDSRGAVEAVDTVLNELRIP